MKLLETLNKHFGQNNIEQSPKYEGVFICEKKTDAGKSYQIVFIDTSNKWKDEDYSQYIENVVIDKYYQNEGYLQWNCYYYIITTRDLINSLNQRKTEIESDETYTRKSVLTEEEFIEWLTNFNSISDISKESISNDLYTNWVNYLRDKELYFIFDSERYPNYKQPVEDYVNGHSFEDIDDVEINEHQLNTKEFIQKIQKLELIKFREFPEIKNFNLGSVNLIQGANAVGKTSFFDAIELAISGKLFSKVTTDSYKINLVDESDNILQYPDKPATYKRRDIAWYNSGVNRGNELNLNFNKFNYLH